MARSFSGVARVFVLAVLLIGCALALAEPTPPPLYEAPARPDRIGRILVPIMVNQRGPFRFVLDTGANRTVITPRLAEALGLTIATENQITMSGVTGSASVSTVAVEEVKAGDVVMRNQHLPVAASLSSDVDGILGVDALADTRVFVNFDTGKIQIRKAHREGVLDGMTRVPGKFRFGRLLVVPATIGRIPVRAVIDTGSEYTLANFALRTRLGLKKSMSASSSTDVIGETLALQRGERRQVPVLRMGEIQIAQPTVIFGEFYVFRLWNLESEPAVVIGMDMIGSLEAFLIDYQRGEIQVRTRGEPLYVR